MDLYNNFKIDFDKCLDLLNTGNYVDYKKEYSNDNDIFKPAQYFFDFTGIPVHKKWNLGGLTEKELQVLAKADYCLESLENCKKLFIDLKKLNPELKKIRINRKKDLYDVIMGIASTFNINDIIFYIGDYIKLYGQRHMNMEEEMFTKNLHEALRLLNPNIRWGHYLQWVTSPETNRYITHEVLKKITV